MAQQCSMTNASWRINHPRRAWGLHFGMVTWVLDCGMGASILHFDLNEFMLFSLFVALVTYCLYFYYDMFQIIYLWSKISAPLWSSHTESPGCVFLCIILDYLYFLVMNLIECFIALFYIRELKEGRSSICILTTFNTRK